MKHRIKVRVPVEKRGLLGFKKTVMETRTVEIDGKTYRKITDQQKKKPYSVEEMIFYDGIHEKWCNRTQDCIGLNVLWGG